jgi:ribosomal protein S15P/S13E
VGLYVFQIVHQANNGMELPVHAQMAKHFMEHAKFVHSEPCLIQTEQHVFALIHYLFSQSTHSHA